MGNLWKTIKRSSLWLGLLISVDVFSALTLWLSDAKAFKAIWGTVLLFSIVLFTAAICYVNLKEEKKQKLFQTYISNPDEINEEKLFRLLSTQEREQLSRLSLILCESENKMHRQEEDLRDYEEYVEAWAHEAKTPLSLLTMILDNRQGEIPANIHGKLDYVRSELQDNITQILYYARLKSTTKDYRFERLDLQSLIEEVLEDYAPLLEEKNFAVFNKIKEDTVFSDQRGIRFMLSQIVSNAIKYSRENPILVISFSQSEREDVLTIGDNGTGVKPYDLPYIFQKGFTGDSTDRRNKATGMGLYLTSKMAEELNLKINAKSKYGEGFSVSISFPKVCDY